MTGRTAECILLDLALNDRHTTFVHGPPCCGGTHFARIEIGAVPTGPCDLIAELTPTVRSTPISAAG